jgi:hypothetical protein
MEECTFEYRPHQVILKSGNILNLMWICIVPPESYYQRIWAPIELPESSDDEVTIEPDEEKTLGLDSKHRIPSERL